jgi:hypothetical protein
MTTVTAKITAAGLAELDLTGSYTVAPAPSAQPAIPDGIYPMGWASVQGSRPPLKDCGDWNFATMGNDLSGWRIHGAVTCRNNGIVGDGFEIVGAPTGSHVYALLDFNAHFATPPNFKHFTINPDVTVESVNGYMGDEATLFDFDISNVGGDSMSPNNLHTSLPLNMKADWGYCHDLVWYKTDPSHPDGTHNDDVQIPGGTTASFTRIYMTGLTSPTRGDGAYLRTTGPAASTTSLPGPRPLGQCNSAVMITQNVSKVSGITFDHCRFGGGWYSTINMVAGSITVTNSVFNGNSLYGLDMVANVGATLVQSGNTRVDGKALRIKLNN